MAIKIDPIKNNIRKYFLIAAGVLILSCSKNNSAGGGGGGGNNTSFNAEITIMANDAMQLIQGFGCATVFNPPNTTALTNEEITRLFGSGDNQVGLNILRIRVAEDAAWRNTELNYAKAAIQNGARILATPWSPPANMKTNNSLIGGSLKTDSSAAYANYLNAFAEYMTTNGAPVYAVSVQNEPDISVNYESCDWTADQMRIFLKDFGHFITNTLVMAPESFHNDQNFVNTILNDNGAATNLDIVGGHIYGSGIVENTLAKSLNKEVWMTEHLDTNVTYTGNMNTAIEIHDCLTKANFNAYIWWYGKRFYGPIGQDGLITKRGYIMSQFARFIPSGSIRIGAGTNSRAEVLISAYKKSNGKKIIIAINTSSINANQKISINDATISSVLPYTTSATKNAERGSVISATNNSFTYLLPAQSITTFIEQ
ncbi:MAG TPA: glycoside hydrolase family 30 beta sandwich domain-containing protein [Chitinophagaceae bacterium]|nr:glycoside hydrolase family 30 beta sandwich domain-containing protein [Chitinophagaceae bacterium]